MILKSKSAAAFKCEVCGSKQMVELDLFKLFMGKKVYTLVCEECNSAYSLIERGGEKGVYKLHVPCCDCLDNHTYSVNASMFWQRLIKLKCPMSGNVVFVCGEADAVEDSLKNEFAMVFENAQTPDDFEIYESLDELMRLMEHLRELDKRNNIICPCGSTDIAMRFDNSIVHFKCNSCGHENVLDVSSREYMRAVLGVNKIELI